jgi:hypothetical protein
MVTASCINQPKGLIANESRIVIPHLIYTTLLLIAPVLPFNAQNIFSYFINHHSNSQLNPNIFTHSFPIIVILFSIFILVITIVLE